MSLSNATNANKSYLSHTCNWFHSYSSTVPVKQNLLWEHLVHLYWDMANQHIFWFDVERQEFMVVRANRDTGAYREHSMQQSVTKGKTPIHSLCSPWTQSQQFTVLDPIKKDESGEAWHTWNCLQLSQKTMPCQMLCHMPCTPHVACLFPCYKKVIWERVIKPAQRILPIVLVLKKRTLRRPESVLSWQNLTSHSKESTTSCQHLIR